MNDQPVAPATEATTRTGLAIGSLVLGVVAAVLSVFVVGALFGLVGLVSGIIHIRSRHGANVMAWWGIALSTAGILMGISTAVFYIHAYKTVRAMTRSEPSMANLQAWEGVRAPEITVTTLDGRTIELSQLRGKRVVIDFFATWCPPCVKEIPDFMRLHDETSRDALILFGISSEPESTLKPFVKKHGINYPIASAKNLPAPYKDIRSIPTTFFIDRNGIIQTIAVGYHDFESIKKSAVADDLKSEPKPAPVTTNLPTPYH